MNIGSKIGIATIVIIMIIVIAESCSAQSMTRNWGGEMETTLEPNKKLVEVTWKNDSLWYLTKDMKDGDEAETYEFSQSSSLGIFEGTVIIHEVKLSDEEYAEYVKWRDAYKINYNRYMELIDSGYTFESYYDTHYIPEAGNSSSSEY